MGLQPPLQNHPYTDFTHHHKSAHCRCRQTDLCTDRDHILMLHLSHRQNNVDHRLQQISKLKTLHSITHCTTSAAPNFIVTRFYMTTICNGDNQTADCYESGNILLDLQQRPSEIEI